MVYTRGARTIRRHIEVSCFSDLISDNVNTLMLLRMQERASGAADCATFRLATPLKTNCYRRARNRRHKRGHIETLKERDYKGWGGIGQAHKSVNVER